MAKRGRPLKTQTEEKIDCFALNQKNDRCEVLIYKKCIGFSNCNFYKTHEQYHKDREEAARVYKERTGAKESEVEQDEANNQV